jgi:dihydroorotase-like cyclic amidohydrolase
MNIYEYLKDNNKQLRIVNSYDNRWLLWDDDDNNWKVYEKKLHARVKTTVYSGDSCDEAMAHLVHG